MGKAQRARTFSAIACRTTVACKRPGAQGDAHQNCKFGDNRQIVEFQRHAMSRRARFETDRPYNSLKSLSAFSTLVVWAIFMSPRHTTSTRHMSFQQFLIALADGTGAHATRAPGGVMTAALRAI